MSGGVAGIVACEDQQGAFIKATKLTRAKKLKVFLIAHKVLMKARNYLRMSGRAAECARFEIVFTVTP